MSNVGVSMHVVISIKLDAIDGASAWVGNHAKACEFEQVCQCMQVIGAQNIARKSSRKCFGQTT